MSHNIKATSDVFFKFLLGSEHNEDLLISFLNAVQKDAEFELLKDVEIKNPFNLKEYPVDKETIVDIKAIDENGRIYDVEMQATGEKGFESRSLYYWAKQYASQLDVSDKYKKLKPAICINVLNFVLFSELTEFHTCFLPTEKNNREYVLTDHLRIHFLELPKLSDEIFEDKLNKWLMFFINEGQEDDIMKILIKDNDIAKAHEEYKRFTRDDKLRALHHSREMWKHDQASRLGAAEEKGIEKGIKQGIEQGIEQGMEKGIEKANLTTAKKLFAKGWTLPEVSEFTGLPEEVLLKLQTENK